MIKRLMNHSELDLEKLLALQQKPRPFETGEPLFWTDPHISRQMLAAHLDPNTDAASRRPETIARSVDWIVRELALSPGAAVLDLGCGPGLYAARLSERGLKVTGVDFSQRSIAYAKQYARDHHLGITYRCQDYLGLEDESCYEAALLIYGDFCPLSPDQRRTLLANIHRALKPQGALVLDVSRHDPQNPDRARTSWSVAMTGFWRPTPHLVLEQTFSYPEQALQLDQYIVVERDGTHAIYRVWRQEYTRETIAAELAAGGFEVQRLVGDLTGMPDAEDSAWIGITARKK